MKAIKSVLVFVSGLIAVVPGFVILKTSIGVPLPNLQNLFFGVIEATGCLTILLLILNKEKIVTKTSNKQTRYSLLFFGVFILGLIFYILLFNYCVVETPSSSSFFPLIWTDGLKHEVFDAGGKIKFVEKWLTDGSISIIQKTAGTSLSLTIVLFLLVYTLTLVSLIGSFIVASFNIKE